VDGAYPPLILALNFVREGAEAEVFFTFTGIDVIKKDKAKSLKYYMPGCIGAISGMTLLASWMMKRKIEKAEIPSIEELLEMCALEGVKFIACKMTMDMLGLKKEDLIDKTEILSAPDYAKKALEADINIFTR